VNDQEGRLQRLRERLLLLEQERVTIEGEIAEIAADGFREAASPQFTTPPAQDRTFDNRAKVELFRSLFQGRTDVFPQRWENPKTGKSGYAPACGNEWKRGLCGKPQVKMFDVPQPSVHAGHRSDDRKPLEGTWTQRLGVRRGCLPGLAGRHLLVLGG
jgi:hypothetical protein